jgi:hypothetical protein
LPAKASIGALASTSVFTFFGKARRDYRSHPAALAEADEINTAAEFVVQI